MTQKFVMQLQCWVSAFAGSSGILSQFSVHYFRLLLLKDYNNRMVLIASSAERALPWVKFDLGSLWPPFPFFWLVEAGGWVELIGVG
jgi:hypothetical protein